MVLTTIFQTVYPEPLYLQSTYSFEIFSIQFDDFNQEKKIVKSKKKIVDFLFIFFWS